MVYVEELHYEFELGRNTVHAGAQGDISAVDVDAYLNRSKDIILERYDEIVEKNRVIENHLRTLEVTKDLIKINSKDGIDVFGLPKNYYNYLRVTAKACNLENDCKEPVKLKTVKYTQQDDLEESFKDPFRTPNWNWLRGLYNFTNEGLEFYHNGKYDLKELTLTYIKYLPDVACATCVKKGKYLKSDQRTAIVNNRNLDLPRNETLWRKIVEIAVYLHKKDVDDNYKEDIETFLFNQNLGVS